MVNLQARVVISYLHVARPSPSPLPCPHTIIIPTSNMHVNKRIGRFKQWAGERMGGEAKTCLSDDFKAMETEMGVRHEGDGMWKDNRNQRLCREQ
jgi:hypothetical protein